MVRGVRLYTSDSLHLSVSNLLGEVGEVPPPSAVVEGGLESGTGSGTGRAMGGGGGGGNMGVGKNGL